MTVPRRRSIGAAAVAAVVCCLAVAGAHVSAAAGADNQTFVYDAYTQIMINWDPATAYEQEPIAFMNLYETLTRYNPATKTIEPVLATKWKSSKDSKTWTFTLRRGVTFHTGRPFNAQAAKAAILRTKQLGQAAAYMWDAVKSISTPSPYTLVFHLKYAQPMALITSATYSAYMYDTKAAASANLAKWFGQGHDAGTGPYMVKQASPGQEVELVATRYPKYWRGWQGQHFQNIEFRVVREDSTAAQLAKSGQVDFVQQITPTLWQTFQHNPSFQTPSAPSFQNVLMYLNTASGPLKSLAVRRAVSMAIDYNGIVTALRGAAVREHGIIPNGLFGHTDSIPLYQYDPAQAKKLLAAAGYGGGHKLSLTMTYTQGDSNEQLMTTLIKSNLAAVGINATVQALTTSTKYAKARSTNPAKRQDITFIYWWPDYPDPATWFLSLLHTQNPPSFNFSYYSNKALDKEMDEVDRVTATNPAKAQALYRRMEMTVHKDVPLIAMYTVRTQRILPSSIVGFTDNPSYPDVVFVYDVHAKG